MLGSELGNQIVHKETQVMAFDPIPVLRVTKSVEQEPVLLLALCQSGQHTRSISELAQGIIRLDYWRGVQPDWHAAWQDRCVKRSYVSRANGSFELTSQGSGRLHDLCTLAYALRNPFKHLTTAGFRATLHARKAFQEQNDKPLFSSRPVSQINHLENRTNYHVYVVLLKADVVDKCQYLIDLNPNRRISYACLYVGHTARTPNMRFESHRYGNKASKLVRDYGVCLVPDLYAHLNPLSSQKRANETERKLALSLRKQGYTTTAGHHDWPIRR